MRKENICCYLNEGGPIGLEFKDRYNLCLMSVLIFILVYNLCSIRGTTAVEITSGLHWYLKYWCGAHISWDKTGGIQIASIPKPGALPRILKDEGVIIKRPVPWNYYQNVVTSSCKYWISWVYFLKRWWGVQNILTD